MDATIEIQTKDFQKAILFDSKKGKIDLHKAYIRLYQEQLKRFK
jgi:hypothetical protein